MMATPVLEKTIFPLEGTSPTPSRPPNNHTDHETLEYDANDNVTARGTREGDWIQTTYDRLNRETARESRQSTKTTGTLKRRITTGYDKAGRVTSRARTDGTNPPSLTYMYDDAGRMTSEQHVAGTTTRTIGYAYDDASNMEKITWPSSTSHAVKYVHDALNRVEFICESTSPCSITNSYVKYEYDELNRRKKATLGNGRVVQYGYKRDSALESVSHVNLIDSDDDDTGDKDAKWTYGYNAANQVTEKTLPRTFLYQPTSLSDEYTANGLNQYTAVGTAMPTYDDNGNLIEMGVWEYDYDLENRLTEAVKTEGGVTTTSTYAYGPEDRRLAKTVGTVTTNYLWAGDDIIAEYGGTGTLLRRYIPGPGIDEPVAMVSYNSSGAKTATAYYHADHAGTVVALSDTDGDLEESYTYSAFGEVGTEGVEGNPFRYTGRQLDPETGLYYYRARYYSAALGRFLQTDPIGYGDSLNLYQYALNDPVNFRDPTGQVAEPPEDVPNFVFTLRLSCPNEEACTRREKDAVGYLTEFTQYGSNALFEETQVAAAPFIFQFLGHGVRIGGTVAASANLARLGLKGVNLLGKSFNAGKRLLEKAGFRLVRKTSTGRKEFRNNKGTTVTYDSRGALTRGQRPHWTIQDAAGNYYSASGKPIIGQSPPMGGRHIPAGR